MDEGFPRGASDRAEGYRHLCRLLIRALVEQVEFADPAFPALYRHNDDVMRWGGPNVDNTYWRAPISAEHTYRVDGRLPPGALFVVQSAHGEMHQGNMGITAERSSADFDVDADGSFSFVVSAAPHDGNWLPIGGQTDHLSIREYVVDWARDEPGRFLIERLGSDGQQPEPLAFANRTVCLNNAQVAADPDGRFRLVVAHNDPGVQNWLDTEGRREAFIAFRWVLSATMPTPEALVVPFAEIDQHLPDFVARATPQQRAAQIAVRRRSRALRFRR